jgi:hypothetical protein
VHKSRVQVRSDAADSGAAMLEESEQRHVDRLAKRMLEQHGSGAVAVAEMLADMATPRGSETWAKVVEALRAMTVERGQSAPINRPPG